MRSPRLALKELNEANHDLPLFRLPQELHDQWIGHVAQSPGGPGGPGPVNLQDLHNLRLASKELKEVSTEAWVDRNFENLELRLETRTNDNGAIDFLLRRMHFYRSYNPGKHVKSIRFVHNETLTVPSGGFPIYTAVDPTRAPLTTADSALLGPRLNTLFQKTKHLRALEILAPPAKALDADLEEPLAQLRIASRYPTMALDRVDLTSLDYSFAYNIVDIFLSRWRQSLSSIFIHEVSSTCGVNAAGLLVNDWPRIFDGMRDNMPRLNRVSLFRLGPGVIDISQNVQLVPTDPVTEAVRFMNMTENIPVGVQEGWQLRIGSKTELQGRIAVKCGLNSLLQLHNLPRDPAWDLDAVDAAGIIVPVP